MVCFMIQRREIWSGNSRKPFLGHLSPPDWQPEMAYQVVFGSSAAQLERKLSQGARVPAVALVTATRWRAAPGVGGNRLPEQETQLPELSQLVHDWNEPSIRRDVVGRS